MFGVEYDGWLKAVETKSYTLYESSQQLGLVMRGWALERGSMWTSPGIQQQIYSKENVKRTDGYDGYG